jgi:type IV secretion system protein VirD4
MRLRIQPVADRYRPFSAIAIRVPGEAKRNPCDEIAQLGRLDAFLTASTLMRGYGMQLWTFWQNVAQLALYQEQARTILDNAGVVQLFGARNRRMAEKFAGLVGGISADTIMEMRQDELLLLVEGGTPRYARRVRYFEETMFKGLYDDRAGRART